MIRKTRQGYVLYSMDGARRLGGPYLTREEALRRERQVQFFKQLRKKGARSAEKRTGAGRKPAKGGIR